MRPDELGLRSRTFCQTPFDVRVSSTGDFAFLTLLMKNSLLEQISSIHEEYQREIESLRKSKRELEEGLGRERKCGRTLVENLRILRRRIKKLEYLAKKLSESTAATKRENLNLI